MNRASLAKVGLVLAGVMLALETLVGSIVALGVGFEPIPVSLGLAFAMGLPVYLLALHSVRAAAIGLWGLFLFRWGVLCCLSQPCHLVSPVWGWASLLPVSALLVTACSLALSRSDEGVRVKTLIDALRQ